MLKYFRAMFLPAFGLRMRRIDAPALVLWGTRDRFLGRELAQPSAALVPNCQVEYFDAGGHWLQHDCPEQVARALLAFLQPVH